MSLIWVHGMPLMCSTHDNILNSMMHGDPAAATVMLDATHTFCHDLQQDTSPQLLLLLLQPPSQAKTFAELCTSVCVCFAEQDAAARRNQESSTVDADAAAGS